MNGPEDADAGDRSNKFIREIWTKGPGGNEVEDGRRLISAGNYSLKSATELADTKGDLIAFGRLFISNVRDISRVDAIDTLIPLKRIAA